MVDENPPCDLCLERQGTDKVDRLLPVPDAPTHFKGGRGSAVLRCMDCGLIWTLIDEIGQKHWRHLERGHVFL
jgi:hypothetical protein